MQILRKIVVIFLCVFSAIGYSNTDLVTGYWQTIDSKTKKPNSIIHVKKNGEFYEGVIEKTYVTPYEQRTHRCMHCVGNKKDQLILGLTIIEHMTCSQGLCKGGTVLDPRNGNLYHATMRVINAGKQLRLRGYIGIPLFGKSVIWNRVTGKE